MTPKARAAFEIYRGLGPARTTKEAAALVGTTQRTLQGWSSKYEWVRLCVEHDHADLNAALSKREYERERTTQVVVNAQSELIEIAIDIARDARLLPVLDRQGEHLLDPDGVKMFRPVTRASTRLEAIKWLAGLVGHVPVKRIEMTDRTAGDLDAIEDDMRRLSTDRLRRLTADLRSED